jgi:hypothetical protein
VKDRRYQSARSKVKRANAHIDSLIGESAPLSKDLYEIRNGPWMSTMILRYPDCFELAFRPKQPLTDHFGGIVGDAVNNLREALDYWANAAVATVGPPKRLHFPFAAKWDDLEASGSYVAIKKAFPDFAEFVRKEIEPCRDRNLNVWAATSLCNDNKHDDFLPTVSVVSINNVNASFGGNVIKNCGIRGDANRPIHIIRSGTPIAIDQNFSTSVEIAFPKGAVFEDQPVIPTLLNMSQVVSQTLDALDVFIAPYI